ncbi:hypothetical protein CEXT_116911 [Caerostris extrusa]|uniref:Uncharacterized protein n=1 Tax=Caerostris extrusa TaxID=172846 RepID=A0AAV4XYL9_CAEEX|nr:hypothetical protein CEXT_116911 [Caerostris extrusa]
MQIPSFESGRRPNCTFLNSNSLTGADKSRVIPASRFVQLEFEQQLPSLSVPSSPLWGRHRADRIEQKPRYSSIQICSDGFFHLSWRHFSDVSAFHRHCCLKRRDYLFRCWQRTLRWLVDKWFAEGEGLLRKAFEKFVFYRTEGHFGFVRSDTEMFNIKWYFGKGKVSTGDPLVYIKIYSV